MLDQLAGASLAAWYNRLLAREDWARAALAAHAGRTARIVAGPLVFTLEVLPGGTLAAGRAAPDVTITLDAGELAASWLEPGAAPRGVHLQGDARFAQVMADVLGKLRPDPVEDLARLVGDAPAEQVAAGLRAAFAAVRDGAARAARRGADYLTGENPMLVGKLEWDRHVRELGALLARVDDLEARVRAPAADRGGRA